MNVMKGIFFLAMFFVQIIAVYSQTIICGKVSGEKNNPLPGANIYIEETIEGTTSDSNGNFCFTSKLQGKQTLLISFVGYKTCTRLIAMNNDSICLDIKMEAQKNNLGEVVISSSTFAAGDEKKSSTLSKLDMATSSGGFGDISKAVASMPGTSIEAQEGGLMVRGGESYETATFIDGLLADNAFTSQLPTVPVRGRFSPMFFRGTVFSTGGYSAEYGQALSSALILHSVGIPKKEETYFSLHSAGLYFSKSAKWDNASLSSTTTYNNLALTYQLLELNRDWKHPPETVSENLVFRKKIGEDGLLKAMGAYNYDKSSLWLYNLDAGEDELFMLKNHNGYVNISYKDKVSETWLIHTGIAMGYDDLDLGMNDTAKLYDQKLTSELKLSFSGPLWKNIDLNVGGNFSIEQLTRDYHSYDSGHLNKDYRGTIGALYAEVEVSFTPRLLSRVGARFETLSLSKEYYITPRISCAYKTGKYSQISLAYGQFRQQPQDEFIIYNHSLLAERAEHFIAGFQHMKKGRIFRIEAYYKNYDKLIKYKYRYAISSDAYTNEGNGYAQGMDIYYRDSKLIRNGDFWVSYSYMDSEREYRDFPRALTPCFISKHKFSFAYKQYIPSLQSFASLGYTYATGRPYINPNIGVLEQQLTKDYSDLSLSVFHFTEIVGNFTMLYAQVSNLLGAEHIFGYRYSRNPNPVGIYQSIPIKSVSKRFLMAGIIMSFSGKIDM